MADAYDAGHGKRSAASAAAGGTPARPRAADFDSTGLPPGQLAERMATDSFLYFRGLLDRGEVQDVRRQVVHRLQLVGWLATGTDPMLAVPGETAHHDRGVIGDRRVRDAGWREGYTAVQSLEALHRLAHSPALVAAVGSLLGAKVLVHPRKIARISSPAIEFPTPPHQDALFNQTPADVLTAWIPLGDCPDDLGSLRVLRGSANLGLLPVSPAHGLGGEAVQLPPTHQEWVGDDYRSGDVMLFHSRTVHMTPPNRGNVLRLSIDCRFQSSEEPVKLAALLPHGFAAGQLPSWGKLTEKWSTTRWVEPDTPVQVRAVTTGTTENPPRLVRDPGPVAAGEPSADRCTGTGSR
ncbi:phytanoyl-CoA dioxygenase family protein [Streptomyces sp. NBC_00536]|uniref:phytanoyl-CoA dioxygenase family protein n=1 Tax=Streptomyces sp. NBC_00536 TaxID=2975769 RepID=UPI002E7FE40C|nr:phytanoyl-CoA dioxygenase family protein [Streptomyces sp. NBC_00536]WUC83283.1 phytanoyl-CoA dioxygenase family protein [Streptomyces sp. NBC_00536]